MSTTKKATAPKVSPDAAVEITPASAWKNSGPPILTLPSGKAAKVRRVGFQAFIRQGMIPNSLLSIVQSSIDKGTTPDVSSFVDDPKKLADMLLMVDDVVVFCVLDPQVNPVPTTTNSHGDAIIDPNRDEDLLYVDEIDDEDKMFIFSYASGGTNDVAQFRSEQTNRLADL